MKNKKLFAILTLVCFMFTLMPMAAFAAAPAVGVMEDGEFEQSVTVKENATVEFVMEDAKADEKPYTYVIVDGDELYATTDSAYTFEEVGTYTVYAVSAAEVEAFINNADMKKAAKWELVQEKDSFVEDALTVKVKADSKAEYTIVLESDAEDFDVVDAEKGKYEIYVAANNGWYDKQGELTATLYKDGEEVKGEDLTFSTAGYVDVITADGTTTDRGGEVEFEVVSDRAGEYKVIVKYGTKAKAELTVYAYAEQVANVELVDAPKAPVDVDQDVVGADIEFKFTDANGKACEAIDVDDETKVKITVTDKPADSNVDEDTFTLDKDGDDTTGVYTLNGAFDEEGSYTIKVTLKNGKSAEVTVKAAELGEIVGIKYDVMNTPRTVAWGESANVDAVLAYDANGVTTKVSADAVFSASGSAVKSLEEVYIAAKDITQYAVVTVEADDDYVGKTITVFAEYEDFVTSTTLTVVDKADAISYADATAEVGVNAEFKGTVVDANGATSGIAKYIMGKSGNGIILEKPENAVAVATWEVNAKGQVVLNFLASEEGEYKVQVAVSYNDANGVKRFVSGIANITVGAGAGTFEDVVVMSIGAPQIVVNSDVKAIDAAPMIENSRTFVPFRALAEAFGADVSYDEATQSVIAELDGVKVVMTIGSANYTVNGVEKAADVAPFINGSRTMVPVRFVAEAFGINVTPIYAENGAVADVLFAK